MDNDTRSEMLKKVTSNDRDGLKYEQNGRTYQSPHFDFQPLITALQAYVDGYPQWDRDDNLEAMKAAWMRVGLAQRDVPAHVRRNIVGQIGHLTPCLSLRKKHCLVD